MDSAIQTTSTSKVRRVDFGGCGPVQSPKSHRQAETGGAGYASEESRCVLHNTKLLRYGSLR
jgi:hypothetical protein